MKNRMIKVLGLAFALTLTWLGLVNAAPARGHEDFRAAPVRTAHYEHHWYQPPHWRWHHERHASNWRHEGDWRR